jgi:hypothetical protein
MDLDGKVAAITGASRGLGAGLAEVAHERGMSLVLCSRSRPALPTGPRVLAAELDVADAAALQRLTARAETRFGHVDLWVNNAGLLEPVAPLRGVEVEALRRLLEVNVLGVIETGMQQTLRAKDEEDFPDVARFRELHAAGALVTPRDAGLALLRLAFDPAAARDEVCLDLRDSAALADSPAARGQLDSRNRT